MQQNKNSTSVMESETIQKNEASSKSHTSRRHFFNYFIIAALAVSVVLTSCGGGGGIGGSSYKIKMTTEQDGRFDFYLTGSGTATVDWGDASEKVTLTLNEEINITFEHTYPNATIRTITINGENITKLSMINSRSYITSLDVSRCAELTELIIRGNLTSLDVSRCAELTELIIRGNLTSLDVSKNTSLINLLVYGSLTSSALNALFGTLHSNSGEKTIYIGSNPGAKDCDRSIAERKGWMVKWD